MDDRHTTAETADLRKDNGDASRVAALHDLHDFQVADGYPDPRGWDVLTADGVKVGKVHDLIVDTGEMRTRYLDIDLDKHAIGAHDDRAVLVPIGVARVNDDDDKVTLGTLSSTQVAALPPFEHGDITRTYESAVLGGIHGTAPADTGAAADFYTGQHFNDREFFGNRKLPTTTRADEATELHASTHDTQAATRDDVTIARRPDAP